MEGMHRITTWHDPPEGEEGTLDESTRQDETDRTGQDRRQTRRNGRTGRNETDRTGQDGRQDRTDGTGQDAPSRRVSGLPKE